MVVDNQSVSKNSPFIGSDHYTTVNCSTTNLYRNKLTDIVQGNLNVTRTVDRNKVCLFESMLMLLSYENIT